MVLEKDFGIGLYKSFGNDTFYEDRKDKKKEN